jgi:3-dehydroquinate dehydratase
LSYYDEINQGNNYLCDRCNVVQLRYDEYENNVRDIVDNTEKMRYCDECRNWITLQHYTDKDGHYHTIRSERLIDNIR